MEGSPMGEHPWLLQPELTQQDVRWSGENTHIDGQEPIPRSLNCSIPNVSEKSPQISMAGTL